jgi:hypothetical protein
VTTYISYLLTYNTSASTYIDSYLSCAREEIGEFTG